MKAALTDIFGPVSGVYEPTGPLVLDAGAIKLHRATISDCAQYHAWRTDPETRKNSRRTREIPFEEYQSEFMKAIEHPDHALLIAKNEGSVSLGLVRFDEEHGLYEISYIVDADHRGHGVGKAMVKSAVDMLPAFSLCADVLETNVASGRVATHAGFDRWQKHDYTYSDGRHFHGYLRPAKEL